MLQVLKYRLAVVVRRWLHSCSAVGFLGVFHVVVVVKGLLFSVALFHRHIVQSFAGALVGVARGIAWWDVAATLPWLHVGIAVHDTVNTVVGSERAFSAASKTENVLDSFEGQA